MILVRDIFQLKFGKAREAMDLLRKNMGNVSKARNTPDRFLTDLTGQYYTLIMETHYENMTEYEQSMKDTFRSEEWRKGYQGFAELVESDAVRSSRSCRWSRARPSREPRPRPRWVGADKVQYLCRKEKSRPYDRDFFTIHIVSTKYPLA